MANITAADGNIPLLNPGVYANLKAELNKAKEKTPARGLRKFKFSNLLDNALEETRSAGARPASEEALQELLDEVHSAGDLLKKRPFPEEIKRYKRAVGDFLQYVVENSFAVAESTGGNILRRKKYTMIQVVDRKLEQLAAGILSGQSGQLELLARVDEIAGLLVNLLQ
jgi:uncharacterized protein YaaR (DUF327 family)